MLKEIIETAVGGYLIMSGLLTPMLFIKLMRGDDNEDHCS